MVNEWSLRDEILVTSHRWPVILLWALVGAVLGGLLSRAWPSPHQASAELYVGLDVYRALDDRNVPVQFNYPDDYKNWQMANLNVLVKLDEVTRTALEQLRQQDPFWIDISRESFSSMLSAYWRNAGRWRLVAKHRSPQRAAQAAAAWQAVVLERAQAAIFHAQQVFVLDDKLQANSAALAAAGERLAGLEQARQALAAWRQAVEARPGDQAVDETGRQELLAPLLAAGPGPAVEPLLAAAPLAGARAQDMLAWLGPVEAALGGEIGTAQAQVHSLQAENAALSAEYAENARKSMGFSANLVVEQVSDAAPQTAPVRPTPLMVLVGGAIGLLAWLVIWLARITGRGRR